MFALILATGLSSSLPPYATETLHAFAAVSNDRIIDGVAHSDGNGVVSAGLLFADPAGLFANTRLSAFTGSGRNLPEESLLALDTAIGWNFDIDTQAFSIALLDYRLSNDERVDYQGLALRYELDAVSIEFAIEPDRHYFYPAYNALVSYDAHRWSIEWRNTARSLQWYAGAGSLDMERVPGYLHHVSTGAIWQWQGLALQLGVVHAWRDRTALVDDEGTRLFLSVSRGFRWH